MHQRSYLVQTAIDMMLQRTAIHLACHFDRLLHQHVAFEGFNISSAYVTVKQAVKDLLHN